MTTQYYSGPNYFGRFVGFVLALVLGRGVRYLAEGMFAVRYGQGALVYLVSHAGLFILMVAGLLVLIYLANRLVLHTSPAEE